MSRMKSRSVFKLVKSPLANPHNKSPSNPPPCAAVISRQIVEVSICKPNSSTLIGPRVKLKIAQATLSLAASNALRKPVGPPGNVNVNEEIVVVNGIPPIVPLIVPPVAVISPVVGLTETPSRKIPVITIGMIDVFGGNGVGPGGVGTILGARVGDAVVEFSALGANVGATVGESVIFGTNIVGTDGEDGGVGTLKVGEVGGALLGAGVLAFQTQADNGAADGRLEGDEGLVEGTVEGLLDGLLLGLLVGCSVGAMVGLGVMLNTGAVTVGADVGNSTGALECIFQIMVEGDAVAIFQLDC